VRPRLLDLFCGAGGAAMGYHRAGFEVVGVDIERQPNYPFEFHQGDALNFLEGLRTGLCVDANEHGEQWLSLAYFHAIHASPPCQDYSRAMRHLAFSQPRLIDPVRDMLKAAGLPWVVENVPGAPLRTASNLLGEHGVELCGSMFGLPVRRHRLFETSMAIWAPCGCDHSQPAMNPHNQAGRDRITEEHGRGDQERPWREAMGVPWMGRYEAREAIPPAYTEYIGGCLMAEVERRMKDAA
jgi:DNA (cytosine-5)-methyltransferase 1